MTYWSDEQDAMDREELRRESRFQRQRTQQRAQHPDPRDPDYEPEDDDE